MIEPFKKILQKRTQETGNKPGKAVVRRYRTALLFLTLCYLPGLEISQIQAADADWEGEWLAEGTLFRIGVTADNGLLKITQIESMGQVWSSGKGEIEGVIARVPVEYAGVNGIIQAKLLDSKTAVLSAASCQPDYMVVCALSQGRQAIFIKVASPAASTPND